MTEKTKAERCVEEGHRYEVVKRGLFDSPTIEQCKWCGHKREYLEHCCHESGYGTGYGYYCPACESRK